MEQGVHRALEADVKLTDLALGQGDNPHASELQVLEQYRNVRLIAANTNGGMR